MGHLRNLGALFSIVNPWDHMYQPLDVKAVPDYVAAVSTYFIMFVVLEFLYLWRAGKHNFRMLIIDGLTSVSAGTTQRLVKTLQGGFFISLYTYVYTKINIIELPWDSVWTWILCFLIMDFAYYVFHRSCHEVNFLWGFHVAHHSSEYYNLTTALRQSAVSFYAAIFIYLPAALIMPPSSFAIQNQLNLLYQFWIHTETIGNLGPLELIINTPSHHRVHHGSNRYCIDKNYGGTLIIWDRLFGTFTKEKTEEKVVYGLTHNIATFNPFTIQTNHFVYLVKRVWNEKGWGNKIKALVYGPGWVEGKQRLGDINDIPDVHAPVTPHSSQIGTYGFIFAILLAVINSVISIPLIQRWKLIPFNIFVVSVVVVLLQYLAIGLLFDKSRLAFLIQAIILPFVSAVAALFFQSQSTVFHVILGVTTANPDTLNLIVLVGFVVLSLVAALIWSLEGSKINEETKKTKSNKLAPKENNDKTAQ